MAFLDDLLSFISSCFAFVSSMIACASSFVACFFSLYNSVFLYVFFCFEYIAALPLRIFDAFPLFWDTMLSYARLDHLLTSAKSLLLGYIENLVASIYISRVKLLLGFLQALQQNPSPIIQGLHSLITSIWELITSLLVYCEDELFVTLFVSVKTLRALHRRMEAKAGKSASMMRGRSTPADAQLEELLSLKWDIKQRNIVAGALPHMFESIRSAIASKNWTLQNAGFSTLKHLLSRLTIQRMDHQIASHGRDLCPVLLERLGDQREDIRAKAAEAFTGLWPALRDEVEHNVLKKALEGKNPKSKAMSMTWLANVSTSIRLLPIYLTGPLGRWPRSMTFAFAHMSPTWLLVLNTLIVAFEKRRKRRLLVFFSEYKSAACYLSLLGTLSFPLVRLSSANKCQGCFRERQNGSSKAIGRTQCEKIDCR